MVRDEDVISVVQAGRIVRSAPPRVRKKKEIGRVHGSACCNTSVHHRDRSGGVPGARARKGTFASTTRPVRCRAIPCSTRRRSCVR